MLKVISFLMNAIIVVVGCFVYGGLLVVLMLFSGALMIGMPYVFGFGISGGSDLIAASFAIVAALFWGLYFCRDKLKLKLKLNLWP